ncbi:MAG: carboxypeptidase-like regulatory domain-containing protein, partial [Flavobacteriaceae bacterium]
MKQKQLISFKNVHFPLFSFKLKLSSFLFFMTLFSVLAQGYSQVRITGNISDSNGTPLIGASVVEKGTNNGTQSDFDGNFLIENVKNDGTLIFSYIGFKSIEVSVIGKSTIN